MRVYKEFDIPASQLPLGTLGLFLYREWRCWASATFPLLPYLSLAFRSSQLRMGLYADGSCVA